MQGSVCFIWAVIIQDHVYKLAVVTNAELGYNITIFGKGFLNIPEKE
jgi:hypothetical protein